jgi:Fur family transcriptional regulator, iron response regulator
MVTITSNRIGKPSDACIASQSDLPQQRDSGLTGRTAETVAGRGTTNYCSLRTHLGVKRIIETFFTRTLAVTYPARTKRRPVSEPETKQSAANVCSSNSDEQTRIRTLIRDANLRPTSQRMALAGVLFDGRDRHVTAEMLHEEARGRGIRVSVATVYNTLHQFTQAGLLNAVAVDGSKTFFDTNTTEHHHFYCNLDGRLVDIPGDSMTVVGLPEPPAGMFIQRVEVVVRMARLPRR